MLVFAQKIHLGLSVVTVALILNLTLTPLGAAGQEAQRAVAQAADLAAAYFEIPALTVEHLGEALAEGGFTKETRGPWRRRDGGGEVRVLPFSTGGGIVLFFPATPNRISPEILAELMVNAPRAR